MKKFLAACIFSLMVACTPVKLANSELPKEITIAGICQTEESAKDLYNAILKEEKVLKPSVQENCMPIKTKAKLIRVIDKKKDSDGDDFLLVEVQSLLNDTRGFAIHWPLHDTPPGQNA